MQRMILFFTSPLAHEDTRLRSFVSMAKSVWPGSLTTLSSCLLCAFERSQTNLDDLIYHRIREKQSKDNVKVVEVHLKQTDQTLQVRNARVWGPAEYKGRGLLGLYWAARVAHQSLLLAEASLQALRALRALGYTHVTHGGTLWQLGSVAVARWLVVPRVAAVRVEGGLTPHPVPEPPGTPIHLVTLQADHDPKVLLALDLGYAQYHPGLSSQTDFSQLDQMFAIKSPEAIISEIALSSKPIHPKACKEFDVSKSTPLFKQKLKLFFENFSLSSVDIKGYGNADFEAHSYSTALLWYSLGIDAEIGNESSELLHIFYGNRSTVHYQMRNYDKALEDANEAIRVAPHWPKGYLRKSAVLVAMGQTKESQEVLDQMEKAEQELSQPKNKKRKT